MLKFFSEKNCEIGQKTFTFILVFIILTQFVLVSIIFLKNWKAEERLNARLDASQTQLNEKLNMLQSNMTRLQVEMYRRK